VRLRDAPVAVDSLLDREGFVSCDSLSEGKARFGSEIWRYDK
jgi:hypothetical protein